MERSGFSDSAVPICEDVAADFTSAPKTPRQVPARHRLRRSRNEVLVKEVRDYFEANLSQPIRLTQCCQDIGVSIRRLEHAVADVCGVTPKRLLILMRMARVRHVLLATSRGEATVTEIAVRCGFVHLGRFSVNYAALYGESPSETLKLHRDRTEVAPAPLHDRELPAPATPQLWRTPRRLRMNPPNERG